MYNKAKQQAQKILKDCHITTSPIPVEKIVEKYGIQIRYAPGEEFSGILIKKGNGKTLMGINSEEAKVRRRFTIAHELGHFFLDPKNISIDYRKNHNATKKSLKEKQVDYFAACLLMPKSLLEKDFKTITKGTLFFEIHLKSLANQYQVSKPAMYYRLVYLNLIPREIQISW